MVKVIHVSTSWTVSSSVAIVVIVAIASLVSMTRMATEALVVHMSSSIPIALVVMACVSTEAFVCHMALAIVTRCCDNQSKDCNRQEKFQKHVCLERMSLHVVWSFNGRKSSVRLIYLKFLTAGSSRLD